jgi:tetratricopeptide (TPR) repeat protein
LSSEDGWVWARALRRQLAGSAQVFCSAPADANGRSLYHALREQWSGKAYVGVASTLDGRVPAAWRAACEAVDELWVTSERDRQAFGDAGVPAAKLHVMPSAEVVADWVAGRLARLTPDPAKAMDLGRRAEAEGRLDDAARHYGRAAELKSDWLLPVYNRASVLKRQRRRGAAAGLFERVAKSGETPELRGGSWFHLGEVAFEENRFDEAVASFESCLAERPDHGRARAWISLIGGRREEAAGRLDAARDHYRHALGLSPSWALAKYGLASALRRLGDMAEARTVFADVAATGDQPALRAGAHFHLGEIASSEGRADVAAGHYESCLVELPAHAAAARRLEELGVGTR